MRSVARFFDIWAGVCCCHPSCIGMAGPIITCSPDVYTNQKGNARLTDVTIGWCGHAGIIVSGSPHVQTDGLQQAGVGDIVAGCNIGVIIIGSSDTFTE
jgi:uncharacterized Zn-binding protein involved in type VI secretion